MAFARVHVARRKRGVVVATLTLIPDSPRVPMTAHEIHAGMRELGVEVRRMLYPLTPEGLLAIGIVDDDDDDEVA